MSPRKPSRPSAPPSPSDPAATTGPWRIRFAEEILSGDLRHVGHAALQAARKAIDKKLKTDPVKYGEMLHSPLHGLFKLKVSHLRIVYHVEHAAHEVWVLMIGDRREIWAEAQSEILARARAVRAIAAPPDKSQARRKRTPPPR